MGPGFRLMWFPHPGVPHLMKSPTSFNRTKKVDVLHLCRALESSNASIYIDLSQTPVSNTGTLAAVGVEEVGRFQVSVWRTDQTPWIYTWTEIWLRNQICIWIYMAYVSRVFFWGGQCEYSTSDVWKEAPFSTNLRFHGKQWGRDARNEAKKKIESSRSPEISLAISGILRLWYGYVF